MLRVSIFIYTNGIILKFLNNKIILIGTIIKNKDNNKISYIVTTDNSIAYIDIHTDHPECDITINTQNSFISEFKFITGTINVLNYNYKDHQIDNNNQNEKKELFENIIYFSD